MPRLRRRRALQRGAGPSPYRRAHNPNRNRRFRVTSQRALRPTATSLDGSANGVRITGNADGHF
jgi:hypothetical protein